MHIDDIIYSGHNQKWKDRKALYWSLRYTMNNFFTKRLFSVREHRKKWGSAYNNYLWLKNFKNPKKYYAKRTKIPVL